jgi:hypothetical protein
MKLSPVLTCLTTSLLAITAAPFVVVRCKECSGAHLRYYAEKQDPRNDPLLEKFKAEVEVLHPSVGIEAVIELFLRLMKEADGTKNEAGDITIYHGLYEF